MFNSLIILIVNLNIILVGCFRNNSRLRKNIEPIYQIRANNDDKISNTFPGKYIRTFSDKVLPRVEGDLKFLNDSPNRKLFGEGNDLMVDDQISPQSTFLQTRFSNGNYAIISGLIETGSSANPSSSFYYYLYDSQGHKLINEKKLFENNELDVHHKYIDTNYEVYNSNILSFNEIDSNNFFITIVVNERINGNANNRNVLYSANFNIQGNRIGNFEFITNTCNEVSSTPWRNKIYSMTKRGNDKFACVLRCYLLSSNKFDFYGIGFNSNAKMYGSLNEIFEDNTMRNDNIFIIENLQNQGFLILTYRDPQPSSNSNIWDEDPLIIEIYDKDGNHIKQININPIELEDQRSSSYYIIRKRVNGVYPKSYDNGFIIILTDENMYTWYDNYHDRGRVNTISWLNYDNDGNLISDRQILTDSHNCDYSKIIKNDNNFYLSCEGFSESFPITLNSQDYNINFINSDEKELYDEYEENNKDGITFSTWYDTNHQYLARYNTENIYSFEKILSPTPGSSPDLDIINDESNEGGDNPGDNPGISPDGDQDNTDDSKNNVDEDKNDNLVLILVIVIGLLCMILSSFAYYCWYKPSSCAGSCEATGKGSIEFSSNSKKQVSSTDVKLLENDNNKV